MPEAAPVPVTPTTSAVAPPVEAKAEAPREPTAEEVKASQWAKHTETEKRQRARDEATKKRTAELDARAKEIEARETSLKASEAALDELTNNPEKWLERYGVEGYKKITRKLLPQAGKTAAQQVDLKAEVAKAVAEHEAAREKKTAEERAKQDADAKASAEQRYASLSAQCSELVTNGGERWAQIQAEVALNPGILEAAIREIDALVRGESGWVRGEKVLRGNVGLDAALDMLEDAWVERATKLATTKVKTRLTPGEKSAEASGAKKSEAGGPSTLTRRDSQESTPGAPVRITRDQRKRDEEERVIAETTALLLK